MASVSPKKVWIADDIDPVLTCGPVCARVYPTVTGTVVLSVSVCGPVCALVYPTVTGSSSCCVCLYVVPCVR
jgi:hypothetical protein